MLDKKNVNAQESCVLCRKVNLTSIFLFSSCNIKVIKFIFPVIPITSIYCLSIAAAGASGSYVTRMQHPAFKKISSSCHMLDAVIVVDILLKHPGTRSSAVTGILFFHTVIYLFVLTCSTKVGHLLQTDKPGF